MGGLDVRDPVADRLARRLLQRARAELDWTNFSAEELHSLDVGTLTAHVLFAHVDDAVVAEPSAHGRRCYPVLSRARLGHDAALAEPSREHRLPERVVELVCAGMEEVLALQVQPFVRREPLCTHQRRRASA